MKQDILQEAANIFDKIEKWRAFFDVQQASLDIINHWLTIGAQALREEFQKNHGKWVCSIWGGLRRDTKWHLSELGEKSISIGIGYDTFEFHLFDGRDNGEAWQKAANLLDGPDFRKLVSRIGPRCKRANWKSDKLLLADLYFDPLESGADSSFRSRFIAWHAAHKTDDFVGKTLKWIRQVMEDEDMIRLIRELNERSSAAVIV